MIRPNTDNIPFTSFNDIKFPEVEEQSVFAAGSLNATHCKVRIPDQTALVDPRTNLVYDVHSSSYKTVLHQDLLASGLEALDKVGERYALQVLFPDEGRRMWAKVHLMDRQYEVRKGDFVRPTIEIFGSYDRSWASIARFGGFRLICTNGMVIGVEFGAVRTPHFSVFNHGDLIEMVKDSHGIFIAQTGKWQEWQSQMVTPEQYEKVILGLGLTVIQQRSLEAEVEVSSQLRIEDMKYRTLSTWDFYNLATQNITHDRAMVRNRRRQAETFQRLRRLF